MGEVAGGAVLIAHFLRKWWPFGRPPADTAERVASGFRWHVLPSAAPFFDVPALAEWIASGRAAVVKNNLQRTVYRVPLVAGAVFVKVCRANTPRAWAREVLRPPKARLEFENAVRLQALGVDCTEPLAWGERDSMWPGESIIVTREQANAEPLDGFLTDPLPDSSTRRAVATALGRFFAKLHAVGVRHPDPHPGNFLVELPALRFVLLDVHSVRFGPLLTWAESRANLVLLNRWFQMRATRTDRARFWRAFLASGGRKPPVAVSETGGLTPPLARNLAVEVEAATFASNLRFWTARTGRYLGNNRQFRKVKRGDLRGHAVNDLPNDFLQTLLADPDAVFGMHGARLLKDSPSSTVASVERFILKRFRLKKRFAALRNVFRRSPAMRSWVNGHALLDRGIPTARPLVVLHRYRRGVPHEGYVLFEAGEGAVGLPEAVTAFDRRGLAFRLGRLLRTMHDRQVSHKDLKAPNVLVTADGAPVLIDLVGVTTGRAVPPAQREKELARLAASFATSADVSNADRLRVLRAYLQGDWATWKGVWLRVGDAVRAKLSRNAKLGRPLG